MRRIFRVGAVAAAVLALAASVAPASAASPSSGVSRTPPPITAPNERPLEPAAHGGIHGAKLRRTTPAAVTGTVQWVILRCAYQDVWPGSSRTQSTSSYFDTMFSAQTPGLANYWHAASYGAITLTHTVPGTESEWRPMPHPNSAYGNEDTGDVTADPNTLYDDCASVWDPNVAFNANTYYAVVLDQQISSIAIAFGGGWPLNLDTVSSVRGVMVGGAQVDEPTWAHEMGHAFGLFHSYSQDPSGQNEYDTSYDIMSNPSGDCDPVGSIWDGDTSDPRHIRSTQYGCVPGQTLAWNKAAILGWIPANRQYTNLGGSHTIDLEELAQPVSQTNPLIAMLPFSHEVSYSVESRLKTGISSTFDTGYDENFPAQKNGQVVTKFVPNDPRAPVGCVVINRITIPADGGYETSVLMGTDDNHDGYWDDPGTCFTPGETWTDPTGTVKVRVNSIADSSFNLTVTSPRPPSGTFFPLAHSRILRTGTAIGGHPAPLGAGQTMSLRVLGVGGVPSSRVDAVVLELHALNPSANSIITAWPAGTSRPKTVNLRTRSGEPTDGLVTVKPGTNGTVAIYNAAGSTNLAADVVGYYGESFAGLRYQPVFPFTVLTEAPGGASWFSLTKIAPGSSRTFQALGYTDAPLTNGAVVALEVTEERADSAGNLSVYAAGSTPAKNPDFQYPANRPITREVILPVDFGAQVTIANGGTSNAFVSVELIGFYAPDEPYVLHTVTPTRSVNASLVGGASPKVIDLTGSAGIPNTGVAAVVGTAIATSATTTGFVRLFATGGTSNFPPGSDVAFGGFDANAVAPKIGTNGKVSFVSTTDAKIALDVVGWFGAP